LIECVLKSQSNSETGDDQQAYMNIIKDTITSYPADQQPTYCREQWDAILQYADTYASY
jgi:hypothetical protein